MLRISEIVSLMTATLDKGVEDIRTNIDRAGERASGKTQQSLHVQVNETSDGVEGAIWGRYPFGTLEHGRRPGAVPRGFYGLNGIIAQWIIDKGLTYSPIPYVRRPSERWQPKYTPEQRGLMSLSGAIATKIKQQGTRLFRDGGRDDVYTPVFNEITEVLSDKVSNILEIEVENINTKFYDSDI